MKTSTPNSSESEETKKKRIVASANFGWLGVFFIVIPAMILLFHIVFRLIQFFVIPSGKYILVLSAIPFILPVGFFGLTAGGLLLEPFVGKRAFIKKLGKIDGEKLYRASTGLNPTGYKIIIIFLLIVSMVPLSLIILSIDYYSRITEEGIYNNYWSTFNEENFHPFSDIKNISTDVSLEKAFDGVRYRTYGVVMYSVRLNDGSEWIIDDNTNLPIKYSIEDIVGYISKKSGVTIECDQDCYSKLAQIEYRGHPPGGSNYDAFNKMFSIIVLNPLQEMDKALLSQLYTITNKIG